MLFNPEKSILKGSNDSPVMFAVQRLQLWCWAWEPESGAKEKQSLLFHRSCINREPGRALKTLGLSLKFKIYISAWFLLQSVAVACIGITRLLLNFVPSNSLSQIQILTVLMPVKSQQCCVCWRQVGSPKPWDKWTGRTLLNKSCHYFFSWRQVFQKICTKNELYISTFNLSISYSLSDKGLCSFGNFKNIFTVTVLTV